MPILEPGARVIVWENVLVSTEKGKIVARASGYHKFPFPFNTALSKAFTYQREHNNCTLYIVNGDDFILYGTVGTGGYEPNFGPIRRFYPAQGG